MKNRGITMAIVATISVGTASAQKVKLVEGNLDALKGIEKLNLSFDYSKMSVGKYPTEQEYLAAKKREYNEKEAGKGDSWEKSWIADRKNRFEPQFVELFEKSSDIKAGDYKDAQYTLIYKTTRTEPGFNIGVVRKNAETDAEVLVVETKNMSKVIARIEVKKSPGRTAMGYDYDTGERIQESYAMAGKTLGKFIKKESK